MANNSCGDVSSNEVEDVSDEHIDFVYTITSYGADYPVDSLIKRLKSGDVFIPGFQRAYVWSYRDACRFIESLLLGLPVPGIFVAKESESGKLLVIDGHQRLRTLEYFYNELFNEKKEFSLEDVNPEFEGATYSTLKDQYRRRLDDSIIHLTVVRQDEPTDDNSSIYQIFERLNSGGRKLEAQEIRACIYHGAFNELLSDLNQKHEWRIMFGKDPKPHHRLKDQELILRFFALYLDLDNYQKPMKNFLNDFMGSNKNLNIYPMDRLAPLFHRTIEFIYDTFDRDVFVLSRIINAALFDAIMVGVTKRLEKGEVINKGHFKEKYHSLLSDTTFTLACKSNTSDENVVKTRIDMAISAFDEVK